MRDCIVGDLNAAILEELRGGGGVQCVLELKTAGEAWGDFEDFPGVRVGHVRVDAAFLDGFLIDAKDFRRLDNWATEFLCARKNHFAGFRALLGEDERNAGLQDSGFFAGDFLQGMAEEILVVEIDAGDDGYGWRKDVGGVEAAAEADFEDAEFDAGARET